MKSFKEILNEADDVVEAVDRFKNNQYQFKTRLYKRYENMIKEHKHNYFSTITLNDEYINISENTFIRYVKEYLNEQDQVKDYLCNVDYGTENERMHIHCVLSSDTKLDYKGTIERWGRGAIHHKPVVYRNKYQIPRYILKLGNHTTKTTAATVFRKKRKYQDETMKIKRTKFELAMFLESIGKNKK